MDDQSPATKGDVRILQDDVRLLKSDLRLAKRELRDEMRILHADTRASLASMERHIDSVLQVMTSIDKRYQSDLKGHDRRITRLEKAVF